MTKTPEEMAEEYCNTKQLSYVERLVITKGFIDGYKAAIESTEWQMRALNNLNELIKESEEE